MKNKKKNKKLEYDYLQYRILYNLNSENEWFYDNDTKYLYVWLTGDAVPTTTNIRAKQQSYSLLSIRKRYKRIQPLYRRNT